MHTLLLWDCAYISVQMGHIRDTEVSMESERHATNFGADIVIEANQLVYMHTFFGCMGLYLGSSWLDLREIGIYRIRGTCLTFWNTYLSLCTQASMHAHFTLVCLCLYLESNGIRAICNSFWITNGYRYVLHVSSID